MKKSDVRRWARKQYRDEPVEPWPVWVRVLVAAGVLYFIARVAGVVPPLF